MSATRMMILGLVRWSQPVHGYDVRRELLSWQADKWANVQPGSIYHALRKLTEEGLLREVKTERVGARPARTTYEITAKGEQAFYEELRNHWWTVANVVDPFFAAFSFLPALPREEAAAALRNRARAFEAIVANLRAVAEAEGAKKNQPAHVEWMWQLWTARAEADIAWCERMAALVESGVSYLPESVQATEDWERFAAAIGEQLPARRTDE